MEINGQPVNESFSPGLVEGRPGITDLALRLRDMDAEGLDAPPA